MKKIRIGKDITVNWKIAVNGKPSKLDNMDLRLVMEDPFGKHSFPTFTIAGDVITLTLLGAEQRYTGTYSLTLWVNYGRRGQTVLDACDFVRLVSRTCMEDGSDNGLNTESVELTGNMSLGVNGKSAYESWLEQGHVGTEAEFVAWIREPAVKAVDGLETRKMDITYDDGTTETFYVLARKQGKL